MIGSPNLRVGSDVPKKPRQRIAILCNSAFRGTLMREMLRSPLACSAHGDLLSEVNLHTCFLALESVHFFLSW